MTGRSKIVVTEATNPQVRQVVKTYAVGFGLEVVEVPHRGGTTDPDELERAAADAAAVIFQQPNFFGCLEPAPDLVAAATEAGALPIAHVDLLSLGVLEAPGRYGAALAIGEGQAAGNFPSFGGPHYGFLAARQEFIRRMPGRIVGETVDTAGERGYVLTLQTREQHIRREKATSNITTNQTLLALGGLVYLTWLGPQGLRELGETCLSLAAYAKQRLSERAGLEPVFAEQTTFKEFAVRVGRNARDVVAAARERGVHPGYALGRDYEGMDDVLLVAVTERRTPDEIDRLADVLAEVAAMKLIYERSQAGRRASALPHVREPAGAARAPGRAAAQRAAAPARGAGVRARPPLHGALDAQLRSRHGLLSARLLHDEVQPADQRAARGAAGLRAAPSAAGRGRSAGRARADVAVAGDPRGGHGPRRGLAPAGRRLAGRADGAAARARVLRRAGRGRAAAQGRHPRHGARHESGVGRRWRATS